jgi:hypothetical protein
MLVQSLSQQERNVVNAMAMIIGYNQHVFTFVLGHVPDRPIVVNTGQCCFWAGQFVGYCRRVEIPRIRDVVSDAVRFEALRVRWHEQRGATSSITQMALCPAYQRIIGMGEKAIPLILRQLEDRADDPDHWFWALQAITGEDPVPVEHRGDMKEMARDWLEWAYTAGYDW